MQTRRSEGLSVHRAGQGHEPIGGSSPHPVRTSRESTDAIDALPGVGRGPAASLLGMSNEAIAWARAEASRLRTQPTGTMGGWSLEEQQNYAAAIEFLRIQAPGSAFYEVAKAAPKGNGRVQEVSLRIADLLGSWVDFIEGGMGPTSAFEVQARITAATDLMEQVQRLLEDKTMHEAAAIVLTGAALEAALRSMLALHPETPVDGRPGISSYAAALRKVDAITVQDVKDITAWAGLRNDAAHGDFADVSRQRAQLMADGVNHFMRTHAPS